MANKDVEYDSIASQFAEYREKNVREPVEHYTVHDCMLKSLLDEHGLLTGKRVLDLACGHGHYTRQLKALDCAYVLGVDLSSTIIKLARDIERQDPKGIEYIIADVKYLPSPEQPFDLVTGFYLLHYAQTRDELLAMVRAIYMQLGENKHFIGMIGNVVAGKAMFDKRKYGVTRHTTVPLNDEFIADGTEIIVTFYNAQDEPMCTFSNYHYAPSTYEQVFKEAGFRIFQWVPYQCDPNAPNRAFFDDLINCAPSIGLIATK
jgi:2-polyprenyl-3-methyl-5-hydroxy-6-metoxy-1,4-benzoquinol methylase